MVLFLQCPKQIFWIYLHIKNKLIKFYVEQGILRQFVLGMSFLYDELGSETVWLLFTPVLISEII